MHNFPHLSFKVFFKKVQATSPIPIIAEQTLFLGSKHFHKIRKKKLNEINITAMLTLEKTANLLTKSKIVNQTPMLFTLTATGLL